MSVRTAVLALALGAAPLAAAPDPRASADWWTRNYGRLEAAESTQVARAEALLERLWRAAGQRLGLPPRLVVLARGRPDLLALALPDNSIVLGRHGLEFCLGPQPGERTAAGAGDARLALVLAHELDHLLSDDDWHVAAFAGEPPGSDALQQRASGPDVRYAAELRADGNALLLLVAAGLDPGPALRPVSFLERWAQARQSAYEGAAGSHPAPPQRARLLRREAERLAQHLAVFGRGVAALRAGRSEAALGAFDEFHRRTRYAGKELLNDVGLAHYQLGVRALARCDPAAPLRFRLGTWVDEAALLARRLRGSAHADCLRSGDVARRLEAAAQRLGDAVAADPRYLPARLNLMAVLVLAGRVPEAYVQARELGGDAATARLVEALPRADERRVALENARLVCAYLMRQELGSAPGDALAALRALHVEHPQEPSVLYNLARVAQELGEVDAARAAWAAYLRLDPGEPYGGAARAALASLGAPEEEADARSVETRQEEQP